MSRPPPHKIRAQNRQLQRVIRHDHVEFVLEGVRERALNTVQPDPILLVNFPDIDHQFKVHLLEDSSTLKLTLTHDDGVWCEEIVVPELKLLQHEGEDSDHLVLALDQGVSSGADLTVYLSCVPKGRLHLPHSLREMHERVRHSKVKLYHGVDLELEVFGKGNVERILHDLNCPVERMQAQEAPPPGRPGDPLYTYRRCVHSTIPENVVLGTAKSLKKSNLCHQR